MQSVIGQGENPRLAQINANNSELHALLALFNKRIKELESKAAVIESSINSKDADLEAQMCELEDSMRTISSQLEELKKDSERIIKAMMSSVSEVQDVAASTDLDLLKNSMEDFKPEAWLTRREVERIVEEKLRSLD